MALNHLGKSVTPPNRVVLASNGYADGNAEAIAHYLISKKIEMLCVVKHPLEKSPNPFHQLQIYEYGQLTVTRKWSPPCRPPLTYAFDLMIPPLWRIPRADIWIGFGNLNTFRGLQAKFWGRVSHVIYDCVDFSPARFGKSLLTWIYDAIDRFCCRKADMIWPISDASHAARMEKYQFMKSAPVFTVPMGAWLARLPKASRVVLAEPRIVFLGHLIEKQGIQAVLDGFPLVKKAIPNASFHIIGGGPFADELKLKVNERGLSLDVTFHGFIKDHREVESVLAGGAVAVATYIPEQADFTKFADPGKLKAYLAAGLPIVLTDVSPNAREIAEVAGGELVSYEPESIANKIITILSDPETWAQRNTAALTYVQQFDWNVILDRAFENLQSVTGGSK